MNGIENQSVISLSDLHPNARCHQAIAERGGVDYSVRHEFGCRASRRSRKRGEAVSALVHRDGAHQITVHDTVGREAVLITEGHILHITTRGDGPHLTAQMAQELADQLHQWAVCQQTVRTKIPKRVLSLA